jgi:hypothetical protein
MVSTSWRASTAAWAVGVDVDVDVDVDVVVVVVVVVTGQSGSRSGVEILASGPLGAWMRVCAAMADVWVERVRISEVGVGERERTVDEEDEWGRRM